MLKTSLFRPYGVLYSLLALALIFGILWLPTYPIMIDLPQHAGQLAAMQGLITGQGLWSDTLYINWYTPYLVGYLAALPFTLWLHLSPLIALKLVLTGSYFLYLYALKKLSETLGTDRRLSWLYLPSFFGLPWVFGLFAFLVAMPVGLLLLHTSIVYARRPDRRNLIKLALMAVILFFCHGLAFTLFIALSYFMVFLICAEGFSRHFLTVSVPYVLFAALWVLYFVVTKSHSLTMHQINVTSWGPLWKRPIQIFFSPWGSTDELSTPLYSMVCLAFPWMLGLRPSRKSLLALPMLFILLIWFLAPLTAEATTLLYNRSAILILPFYCFLFTQPEPINRYSSAKRQQWAWVMLSVVLTVFALQKFYRAYAFDVESADFSRISLLMKPNLRVLGVVDDSASKAGAMRMVYANFPMYYQANKGGLVDPSFSTSVAPPVAYFDAMRPKVNDSFIWFPRDRDYTGVDIASYDYFLIRDEQGLREANRLLTTQPVPLVIKAHIGNWTLLERLPQLTETL